MHDFSGKIFSYIFISAQVLIEDFLEFESLKEEEYENNED
jgi:hypothetical protein